VIDARTPDATLELPLDAVVRGLGGLPASLVERAFVWDSRRLGVARRELVVGLGAAEELTGADLGRRSIALLDEHPGLRVFLAMPFDPARPTSDAWPLSEPTAVLPEVLLVADGGSTRVFLARPTARPVFTDLLRAARSTPPPARARIVDDGVAAFRLRVDAALDAIGRGELSKVVVLRTCELEGDLDVGAALAALEGAPSTLRFAVGAGSRWFLGATPELLAQRSGGALRTEAVAGSLPRSGAEDERERSALLGSAKDLEEHEWVVRAIRAELEATAPGAVRQGATEVRTLTRVHHLVTPLEATCAGVDLVGLVERLHPTPAMGGVPRAVALGFLAKHESPRGLYASPIGWLDGAGDGVFAVAIRSALLAPGRARAFAGVGIVRGSEVDREVSETRAKLATTHAALGVRSEGE
jgi:isochorismate synthase